MDHFTKFLLACACKSKESTNVVQFLEKVYDTYGSPDRILSDNGGEFIADIVQTLHNRHKVKVSHGMPYRPQTQGKHAYRYRNLFPGVVERANQTIKKRLIRAIQNEQWKDAPKNLKVFRQLLGIIVDDYNHTRHSSTNEIPLEVSPGHHQKLIISSSLVTVSPDTLRLLVILIWTLS